jgi:hypothetical protein
MAKCAPEGRDISAAEGAAGTYPRRRLYRGWHFDDREDFNGVMLPVQESVFKNTRIGMSASYDYATAQADKFIGDEDNGLSVIWEITSPKTARDLSGIFRAVESEFHTENEGIFPGGSRLRLKPGTMPERRERADGRTFLFMQVEEVLTP